MDSGFIRVLNARENNLKNVSVDIHRNSITIFTGVSGSGKSSIVFDTIAQEAGRQLNETYSSFVRSYLPKYSRPDVDDIMNISPVIMVEQKRIGGNSRSTLGTITDINPLFRILFSRFAEPLIGQSNCFSFNDTSGMCKACDGIGKIITMDIEKAIDMSKSLNEGAILLPGFAVGSWQLKMYTESGFFDSDKKIADYDKDEMHQLLYAEPQKVAMKSMDFNTTYEGIIVKFRRVNINRERDMSKGAEKKLKQFSVIKECSECGGKRYNALALSAKIDGYSIYDLTNMQLSELLNVLKKMSIKNAEHVIGGIIDRVGRLCEIGLGYMSLTRETGTLSGGESQRVKMVKHLSGNLVGIIYIFDEPSTGLHPKDVHKLNNLLIKLRDKGNTILIVEHDPDVIKIADYIVDVGPRAGSNGGQIMYSGDYKGLLEADTLTSEYLGIEFSINPNPRKADKFLVSDYSSLNNLKNVRLSVPEGLFTVVTGVAGSGKSTLVNHVFANNFEKNIIRIDQSAVSANIRSNPATFCGIMDAIRKVFAEENNVDIGLFSYNSTGGCEECSGTGVVELNMSFMDTVDSVCSKCNGDRYKEEVLQYTYKGKNILEVVKMTIDETLEFFEIKEINKKISVLREVGLGYLTLGQPLNTLSGGECQRLKIAKEFNKKGNIYIMDEPTTGLHMSDVANILSIINKLVDKGNTLIVIEHNIEVIKSADWIIDLGPEGGILGGNIVYEGPVSGIMDCTDSVTAKYL